MKKSTILVICIIFLASVLVVGFFGMNAESYYSKVYVDSITPTGYIQCSTGEELKFLDSKNRPDFYPILVNQFVKDMVITIDVDVHPDDATFFNSIKLEITSQGSYGGEDNDVAEIDGRNIKLKQPGFVEVTYRVMDGNNASMTVGIYVKI